MIVIFRIFTSHVLGQDIKLTHRTALKIRVLKNFIERERRNIEKMSTSASKFSERIKALCVVWITSSKNCIILPFGVCAHDWRAWEGARPFSRSSSASRSAPKNWQARAQISAHFLRSPITLILLILMQTKHIFSKDFGQKKTDYLILSRDTWNISILTSEMKDDWKFLIKFRYFLL